MCKPFSAHEISDNREKIRDLLIPPDNPFAKTPIDSIQTTIWVYLGHPEQGIYRESSRDPGGAAGDKCRRSLFFR
jgi:hypothetical protein